VNQRLRRLVKCSGIAVMLMIPGGTGAFAQEASAADAVSRQVDAFHRVLLEVMQSQVSFGDRELRLAPAVTPFFAVPVISRISLGRTWKTLSDDSQQEFSALLEELIVATYADRFDSYSGQSFHTGSAEVASRGWVVKTELEKSDGERVRLDYYFRDGKVFNVVADGVSDLSLRRADYNSIIKAEGYERLVAHIRESIEKHRAGDAQE
jgi:phospholipid transport system substrate-binding protein